MTTKRIVDLTFRVRRHHAVRDDGAKCIPARSPVIHTVSLFCVCTSAGRTSGCSRRSVCYVREGRSSPWSWRMLQSCSQTASTGGSLGRFLFKATATPEIYTLSLHDALPI